MRRIIPFFIFFLVGHFLYGQTIYNVNGKAGGYLENSVLWGFDGTPLMHLSNENFYTFDGKHVGFFVTGILYNQQGQITGFKKGSVIMPTEPDPPKAPKAPLSPKAPLEPTPPRPPLLNTFATTTGQTSNSGLPYPSAPTKNFPSKSSGSVTGNDILSYQSDPALGGVSTGGSIDNSQMNTAVNNLAYSSMELNQYKLQLAYKAKPYMDAAWQAYNKKDLVNAEYNAKQALIIAGNYHFGANYLLGVIYLDKYDYQTAINYLDLAIKQYKKNGDYYAVRGFCHYKLENKKQSKKDFKKGKRKGSKAAVNYLSSLSFK